MEVQCDGLLMNESAENGGTSKKERKKERENRGAENVAGVACVFASLMSNFFLFGNGSCENAVFHVVSCHPITQCY